MRCGPRWRHAATVRRLLTALALVGCVDHVSLGGALPECQGACEPVAPPEAPAEVTVDGVPRVATVAQPGPRGRCDALAWPDEAGLSALSSPLAPGAEALIPFHVLSVGAGTCRTLSRAEAPMGHCVLREPNDLVCPANAPSPFFTLEPGPIVELPTGAQTLVTVRVRAPRKLDEPRILAGRLELWLEDLSGNDDGSIRLVRARLATELPDGPSLWVLATPPVTGVFPPGLVLSTGSRASVRIAADARIPAAWAGARFLEDAPLPAWAPPGATSGTCGLVLGDPLSEGAWLPADGVDVTVNAQGEASDSPCVAMVELRVENGRRHRVPVVVLPPAPSAPTAEQLTVEEAPRAVVLAVDDSGSMAGLEPRVRALGAALFADLRKAGGDAGAPLLVTPLARPALSAWDPLRLPAPNADTPALEGSLEALARLATELRPGLDGGAASPLDPPGLQLVVATNENDGSAGDPLFYEALLRASGAQVHAAVALQSDLDAGVPCGVAPSAGLRPSALAQKLGGAVSSLCKGAFDGVAAAATPPSAPSVLLRWPAQPGSEVLVEGTACAAVVTAGDTLRLPLEDAGCFTLGDAVTVTYTPR